LIMVYALLGDIILNLQQIIVRLELLDPFMSEID